MSLRRIEDAGLMATFAGAFSCKDRILSGAPNDEPVYVETKTRSAKQLVRGVTNKNRERDANIVAEWVAGKTAIQCAEGRGLSRWGVQYILRRDILPAERVRIGASHRAAFLRRLRASQKAGA